MKKKWRVPIIVLIIAIIGGGFCLLWRNNLIPGMNPLPRFSSIGLKAERGTQEFYLDSAEKNLKEMSKEELVRFADAYNEAEIELFGMNQTDYSHMLNEITRVYFPTPPGIHQTMFCVRSGGKDLRIIFSKLTLKQTREEVYYVAIGTLSDRDGLDNHHYKVGNPDALKEMPGLEDYFN